MRDLEQRISQRVQEALCIAAPYLAQLRGKYEFLGLQDELPEVDWIPEQGILSISYRQSNNVLNLTISRQEVTYCGLWKSHGMIKGTLEKV